MDCRHKIKLLSLLVMASLLCGCDLCSTETISEARSLNGKWTVTTVLRNCGAATSEVLAVNVHPTQSKKLYEENNVLVLKHEHAIEVTWKDSKSIQIECVGCSPSDILESRNSIDDLSIALVR
jgi:hypothetical protein